MRPYVIAALIREYGDRCEYCQEKFRTYEIDHKRYGEHITIKELQLLCYDCHLAKTIESNDVRLSKEPHCTTCTCWEPL